MRTVQSFILRLLIDDKEPGSLRGALREISTEDEHPFTDQGEFLNLIHQMIRPTPANEKAGGLERE
ncbi:MAG: hypothetical protein JXA37_13885 [Chloroflexia bacterium]|nr:hypothetical protein [Chloroflexia bacterium]